MKNIVSQQDYVRALVREREELLSELRLRGTAQFPDARDYCSCVRSLEQAIAELEVLIVKTSGCGSGFTSVGRE